MICESLLTAGSWTKRRRRVWAESGSSGKGGKPGFGLGFVVPSPFYRRAQGHSGAAGWSWSSDGQERDRKQLRSPKSVTR